MTNRTLPRTIDDLDWQTLKREIIRLRGYTPEQRTIYFENAHEACGNSEEEFQKAVFDLEYDLLYDRPFHEFAGLKYHDPKNENSSLIRIALGALIAREISPDW